MSDQKPADYSPPRHVPKKILEAIFEKHRKPRTCDSCRHWKLSGSRREHEGMGECKSDDCYGLASINDDAADLNYCAAKFGCVHHEPKES